MVGRSYRILIAEDFEENRTALKLMLKLAGFEVLEASDGQEALNLTLRHRPDLVLMDISLPEIDGLQATRQLRCNEEFKQLPIIIISGYDNPETRDEVSSAGGTDFMSKPIEFDELKKLIEMHLSSG
jgi:CheY-like chemotaxis protein